MDALRIGSTDGRIIAARNVGNTFPNRAAGFIDADNNCVLTRRAHERIGAESWLARVGRAATCILSGHDEFGIRAADWWCRARLAVVRGAIPDRATEVIETADSRCEALEAGGWVIAKHGLTEIDAATTGIEAAGHEFEVGATQWRDFARNRAIVRINRRIDRWNDWTLGNPSGRWDEGIARR